MLYYFKTHYIAVLTVILLLYVVYKINEMFSEQPEKGEINAGGNDYAPVNTDKFKFNNFKLSELRCKDGTHVPAQYTGNAYQLLKNLQILRDEIGLPIRINSGYRSPNHNTMIKGAKNSAHLRAMAADIVVIGMSASSVRAKIIELIAAGKMQDGGVGKYPRFTHYDVSTPRRW